MKRLVFYDLTSKAGIVRRSLGCKYLGQPKPGEAMILCDAPVKGIRSQVSRLILIFPVLKNRLTLSAGLAYTSPGEWVASVRLAQLSVYALRLPQRNIKHRVPCRFSARRLEDSPELFNIAITSSSKSNVDLSKLELQAPGALQKLFSESSGREHVTIGDPVWSAEYR
jgi:hypothetical protein